MLTKKTAPRDWAQRRNFLIYTLRGTAGPITPPFHDPILNRHWYEIIEHVGLMIRHLEKNHPNYHDSMAYLKSLGD